jgi:hypothetical protein
MKDDLNDELPNGIPKTLILFNGVLNWNGMSKVGGKLRGPCYTFLRLDKKIYCTNFNLKMLIWIQWNRANDVSVIYNGWK